VSFISSESWLEWENFVCCSNNSLTKSGSVNVSLLIFGKGFGVRNVMSNDWLFEFVNDFVGFWLDHLDGLDLIWALWDHS